MATLFIHLLADVKKEIMHKDIWSTLDDFTVKMRLLKHLVDVRAVAMHLCSEPSYRSPLLVENCFDNMSYVEIRHLCTKISWTSVWGGGSGIPFVTTRKPTIYTREHSHFLGDKVEIFQISTYQRKAKTPFLLFMISALLLLHSVLFG